MNRPGPRGHSLWPREHGAYGQLVFPLVTGLALGRPGVASGLLLVGAVAAFLGHEPLLVSLGLRGARARREHGGRATRIGLAWAGLAITSGIAGVWRGGMPVLLAALIPLGLVAALLPFVIAGREKTTAGEVLAGAALPAACIPVAVAAGVSLAEGVLLWAVWAVAFTASTAAVRFVIARHKTGQRDRALLGVAAAATLGAAALVLAAPRLGSLLGVAALPMVLAGWALVVRPPHPRNLRRVGWTLVACSAATTLLAIGIARLA